MTVEGCGMIILIGDTDGGCDNDGSGGANDGIYWYSSLVLNH